MIHRLINHLRGNAIAYVALFVALGGTSYAAASLPRGSVGTAQLRNGAVTPAKISRSARNSVAAVTELGFDGVVSPTSTPTSVKLEGWQFGATFEQGTLLYRHPFPNRCTPVVTSNAPQSITPPEPASVSAIPDRTRFGAFYRVQVYANGETDMTVTILCPGDA